MLVETRSPEQIQQEDSFLTQQLYDHAHAHICLEKAGGAPVKVHALAGRLYLSSSGWLMMAVPNAIGQGAFDALDEPGVELPKDDNGRYSCHVSVMRPEEIAQIGGPDVLSERGHSYLYSLGPIKEVEPDNWSGVGKVYYLSISSPALSELRRSYGLSSLPNEGKYEFHATFGIKRRNITRNSDVSKASS